MTSLTEAQALAKLAGAAPITFDDLDDIFLAFGFTSDLGTGEIIWYYHQRHRRCGLFRAEPRYQFSVLSDDERAYVRTMIGCVHQRRLLEE